MLIAVRRIDKGKGSLLKLEEFIYQEKICSPDPNLPSRKLYRVLLEIDKYLKEYALAENYFN